MQHTVVMGVCGSGKSTVARKLAECLDGAFVEADSLHSAENISRMKKGIALRDTDRWPWLSDISAVVNRSSQPAFVSCSALRRSYRDYLCSLINEPVVFVHLIGERDVLLSRMKSRESHFMPIKLLDSQLDTLQSLQSDEMGVEIDIGDPIEKIVKNCKVFVSNVL